MWTTLKVLSTERWVNNETINLCVNGSFKTKPTQLYLCEIIQYNVSHCVDTIDLNSSNNICNGSAVERMMMMMFIYGANLYVKYQQ